jgi:type I restriction enzyme S subunit
MKWKTEKVSSLCDLKNGKAYNADDWATEGLPIIRIQNLNDSSKGFNYWSGTLDKQIHVKPKDLLLAWSGTPGTSFGAHIWNGPEGVLNQHIFRIDILNGSIEKRWFQFCLNQQLNSLIHQAHGGVGLKHVTKGAVDALEIPLPPLAEQKRIAAILDAADALRTKRREALAQLDALLQSTFLTLFGDPVANQMGWEQVELGALIADDDRINYGVVQPGDEYPGGKPLIRVGDFVGGELDLSEIKFIDPKIDAQYERSRLLGTELLVSCVGSIGTVCRVPIEAKGHNIARAVARVPLGPRVEREFMLFCLRSAGVQNYFASETRTVSQPTLNIGLIKTATVTLPPLPLQQKFAAIVESIERQKATQRAHLAELDALFAALQHRAFRGEL